MISRLSGTLLEKQPPQIVIDVHGVGYEVDVSMQTFYNLPAIGSAVQLYTQLIVREDAHLLFGFAERDERAAFRQLLKVSGIGAKTALGILSAMSVAELAQAVAQEDVKRLSSAPGIGKKTAERMVLELRGKLAGGDARVSVFETSPSDSLEADATGRLLEIHGNGMDCRVITTSPGQVTVTTPAGTSTMTTAEMMDQVRAAWPDTTTDALNASTPTRATEREQDASQAQAPELTVYTKPDCPGCRMTKRELDKAGAAYNEIDLTTRPDLVKQFMAEGLRSAPVVELGAERVAGFNPAKIRAIAAQAMSPTPPTAPAPSGAGQPPAPRPSESRIDQNLQVRGETR